MKTSVKPALLDVSLIVPLLSESHAHHAAAWAWFDMVEPQKAIVCRTVQMGFLRISNNPAAMQGGVQSSRACWQKWNAFLKDERVEFRVAEPMGLDKVFETYTVARGFTRQLWSDAYLAAFARAAALRLVSFDQGFKQFQGLDHLILKAD